MRIRIGFNISAVMLYGLNWILVGVAVLTVILARLFRFLAGKLDQVTLSAGQSPR